MNIHTNTHLNHKNGHNTVYEIRDLSHWTAGHRGQWCLRDGDRTRRAIALALLPEQLGRLQKEKEDQWTP